MKRILLLIIITLIIASAISCASRSELQIKELGCPFSAHYNNNYSKTPWDMIFFDGKLFIGSGDYDSNSGPAIIACYDLSTSELSVDALPDEQISSFSIINENLIAPGIDPMDDWSLGNYYIYNGESWETKRNIPYGIHTYQIIEFENKLFAALGTDNNRFPVVVSHDDGTSFSEVKFTKNGQDYPVCDSLNDRVYNMLVLNEKLYAIRFSGGECELFVYKDGVFQYFTKWMNDIVIPSSAQISPNCGFSSAVIYNGYYYFSTGYLFRTKDAITIEYVALANDSLIIDLYESNESLYALAIKVNSDGGYVSSVYQISESKNKLLFEVTDPAYAVSLAADNNKFYLGFGENKSYPDKSGKIIEYHYKGEIQ